MLRQYDLLTNCIEIGLKQGPTAFDKYMLWALNHVAVTGISQFGGRFREEPIYVGDHIPPHYSRVPDLMDRFISFVHENWYIFSPTELAAHTLWRMNWIPFILIEIGIISAVSVERLDGSGSRPSAAAELAHYARIAVRSGSGLPSVLSESRSPIATAVVKRWSAPSQSDSLPPRIFSLIC